MGHLLEADTTHMIWARFNVFKCPNYHNCSKVYQCQLLWHCRKISEEIKCLGSVHYALYQCFLSAIDHFDYNPNMHVTADLRMASNTNKPRLKRNGCNSFRIQKYSHLSTSEAEYLTHLIAIMEKIYKKLHKVISNITSSH